MTETIQVKRETVEEWEFQTDSLPEVRFRPKGQRTHWYVYRGSWLQFAPQIEPELKAAAERLWETIRPLKSGTSDDGSPWGEVRVEGEAPVRCYWDSYCARVSGGDYSKLTAAWFAANPWPVKHKCSCDLHEWEAMRQDRDAWKERAYRTQGYLEQALRSLRGYEA